MEKVASRDGTQIAYDKTGQGQAIILIEGALSTRRSSVPLAELLAPDFSVYSYDRRGRGDSTNTKPFSVQKEIEDIEALIDVAGGETFLYGHSSGGALALETALKLSGKVKKLAIYEVPYDDKSNTKAWREYLAKLEELLAADQRGDAVALFMNFIGVPGEMIEGMSHSPMWPSMEAVAPTLAYDAAVLGDDRAVPTERAAAITAQTLVMSGGASDESMPFMRPTAETLAKAIPNARHQILEGQRHDVDAKVLAPVLAEFFKNK